MKIEEGLEKEEPGSIDVELKKRFCLIEGLVGTGAGEEKEEIKNRLVYEE